MKFRYYLYRFGFVSTYFDRELNQSFSRPRWHQMVLIGFTILIPGLVSNHFMADLPWRNFIQGMMAIFIYLLGSFIFLKARKK
ncbi:hypothetical protein [Halioxenophilus sp. WMMB6]|uniref:hypothetical protein n=1 Tax=Halioxenophilus sp. WMMB6 TaxID=3073815 RepID=UPI00295EC261|nr:hypothetical protein [Halioxenophilus sp. WMMB6]